MLTKDDLKQIKNIVTGALRPVDLRLEVVERRTSSIDLGLERVEDKVNEIEKDIKHVKSDIEDLKLESKGIHEIIKTQDQRFDDRITSLEKQSGIN